MNPLIKKQYATLILVLMLVLSFAHIANVFSIENADLTDVLLFLEDVVMLDVTKYDVELLGTTLDHPLELGGITQVTGIYSLQTKNSNLEIQFQFRNNTLSWCLLTILKGSPEYKNHFSSDVHANARDFLQRYQKFTGDSELEIMKNILEAVDFTKDSTNTINNIKVSVSNREKSTIIDWKYSFNGADFDGLQVGFREGLFYGFSDKRSIYTIGDTDINISKEDAIIVSHLYAENLTWTIGTEKVTEFNIVKGETNPKLLTRSRNEPLKLYPYWYVLLYLDNVYPGNVRHIQVMFWADNGELIDIQPVSFGGVSPVEFKDTDDQSTQDSSASFSNQQNGDTKLSTDILGIILGTMAVTSIVITIATRRKKHK